MWILFVLVGCWFYRSHICRYHAWMHRYISIRGSMQLAHPRWVITRMPCGELIFIGWIVVLSCQCFGLGTSQKAFEYGLGDTGKSFRHGLALLCTCWLAAASHVAVTHFDSMPPFIKTSSSQLGPDEGGKCDSIRLSAVCPSRLATIHSVVVVVTWAKADWFREWLRALSCVL